MSVSYRSELTPCPANKRRIRRRGRETESENRRQEEGRGGMKRVTTRRARLDSFEPCQNRRPRSAKCPGPPRCSLCGHFSRGRLCSTVCSSCLSNASLLYFPATPKCQNQPSSPSTPGQHPSTESPTASTTSPPHPQRLLQAHHRRRVRSYFPDRKQFNRPVVCRRHRRASEVRIRPRLRQQPPAEHSSSRHHDDLPPPDAFPAGAVPLHPPPDPNSAALPFFPTPEVNWYF